LLDQAPTPYEIPLKAFGYLLKCSESPAREFLCEEIWVLMGLEVAIVAKERVFELFFTTKPTYE
jgi:hypothetical protein